MRNSDYSYQELLFISKIDPQLFASAQGRMIQGACHVMDGRGGKLEELQHRIEDDFAQSENPEKTLLDAVADLNAQLSQLIQRIDELKNRT